MSNPLFLQRRPSVTFEVQFIHLSG
jgi:hypothetical protein